MKTLPAPLAAHIASGSTTLGYLLRVTRVAPDNIVFAFTSAQEDVTYNAIVYRASPGLDVSSIQISSGASVDNLELTTLDDESTFTRTEVLGGLWRNAVFIISRYNYMNISDGVEDIMAGTFGEIKYLRGKLVIELRGLQQYLQQPIGEVTSPTCRARLGDVRCSINLAVWTVSSTVTSVTNAQNFTASGLTQVADYFGEGLLTWESGPSIHMSQKVKTHAAGGIIQLSLPMFSAIAIGHTFSITAGCRKRPTQDCRNKFNNILNFQGEPHLPGQDALTKSPK